MLTGCASTTEHSNENDVEKTSATTIKAETDTVLSETPVVLDAALMNTIEGMSSTAYQKHSKMADALYTGGNLIYSPMSLDIAIGMLANGSADPVLLETYANYFGADVDHVNEYMFSLLDTTPDVLKLANKIFVNYSSDNIPAMNADIIMHYDTEVGAFDFNDPETLDYINYWCDENTNGMIPKIVDDLTGLDMLIANALYFKDTWQTEIRDSQVDENGKFIKFDGSEVTATMMSVSGDAYFENEQATGFVKYYENDRFGFVGILPKNTGEFDIAELDIETFMSSYDGENYIVDAVMPEFKFESTLDLKKALIELGYGDIISAHYDNLIADTAFDVSAISQVAKIDLTREGTEAAAITTIGMVATAIPDMNMPEHKIVELTRPFAFMIYDFEYDQMLFVGKITEF